MTDDGVTSGAGGLDWLPQAYAGNFTVAFARGLSARELLLRLGCPEDSLTRLDRWDAEERELDDEDGGHVIRAGEHAGWAYAIQRWGSRVLHEGVIQTVSAGTELVVLTDSSLPWFACAEHGERVCEFDAGLPHQRSGSDPDRFLVLMEQAGVMLDTRPDGVTSVDAMLRLAELAFGLSLPPASEVDKRELPAGVVED